MKLSGAHDGHADPSEGGHVVRDLAEWDFFVPSLDRPTTGHRDDFVSEKPPSAVMAAAPMALGGGGF
jgi:hypothetical protein